MIKLSFILLLFVGFSLNGFSTETFYSKVRFASIEKSIKLVTREDNYTANWSRFDIDARMQKQNSSKEELIQYMSEQPREWTQDEENKISSIIKSIDEDILKQGFKLDFPNKIFFIKSTCADEGGAEGYTRENYIVLKNTVLSSDNEFLKHLITHELFHILTRHNKNFKKKIYPVIGFQITNPIEFPDNIKDNKVTNPDCPIVDSYINLYKNKNPYKCAMAYYSNGNYLQGNLFSNLTLEFFIIDEDMTHMEKLVDRNQFSGFFEQVGKNTHYLTNPEEILAENFAYAILGKKDLPDQNIVNEIKLILQNKN